MTTALLISVVPVVGLVTMGVIWWIALGEPDVNGDVERDGGES
jgi:hypothetical protein